MKTNPLLRLNNHCMYRKGNLLGKNSEIIPCSIVYKYSIIKDGTHMHFYNAYSQGAITNEFLGVYPLADFTNLSY